MSNQFNQRTKKAQPDPVKVIPTQMAPPPPVAHAVVQPPAPAKEPTLTEAQQAKLRPSLTHYCMFAVRSDQWPYVKADIECQPDYKNGNWLYIPFVIETDAQALHPGMGVMFHCLSIDNRHTRTFYERIIRKWNGNQAVVWADAHATDDYPK